MEIKTRLSQANPQQTISKKTELQKSTAGSKTHSHNKSNIYAITDKYLFGASNKKVREINNFHTMTSVLHEIFFATEN